MDARPLLRASAEYSRYKPQERRASAKPPVTRMEENKRAVRDLAEDEQKQDTQLPLARKQACLGSHSQGSRAGHISGEPRWGDFCPRHGHRNWDSSWKGSVAHLTTCSMFPATNPPEEDAQRPTSWLS